MNTPINRAFRNTLAIVTVSAAGLALTGCSLLGGGGGGGDATEEPPATGTTTDVFDLEVGDCLNDENIEGEISEVPKVDCAESHTSEAFAAVNMADGDFPGDTAVDDQAVATCTAEFTTFVGMDYESSALDFSYLFPTEESWANGDREILCLIVDPAGAVTGTLEGAAR